MKILVTGHLGYIGTVLTPMLLGRGHEVVGMDADWFSRCSFGDGIVDVPNIRKDIRDATVSDLKSFDAILHLAALSNDPLSDFDPHLTDQINHQATIRLAQAARDAGVRRFVFSSTCANYGPAGDELVDETAPLKPHTPYARAKVAAEMGLLPMNDDRFCVTVLRSGTAYGWSPRIRFDLVLNNLVAHALTSGVILLKSDGTAWRTMVHIEDIARAFVSVVEAPVELVGGQAFNVGATSENYRVMQIAQIVAETVGECRIEFAPGARRDPRSYRVNCDKLARTVKTYQPVWTVAKGAKQVCEMIRKIGLRADEFEGPRYARLPHVKQLIAQGIMDEQFHYRDGVGKAA